MKHRMRQGKNKGRASIRKRIILFYAVSMLAVITITFCLFRAAGVTVMEKMLSDYLVSAVDANTNKLTFLDRDEAIKRRRNDTDDVFEDYREGTLQIDDDFLEILNNVESALYTEEGELMYGNNPLSREMEGEGFAGERLYRKRINGRDYFVYDKGLSGDGVDGLWIRGIVPLNQTGVQMKRITRGFLLFSPLIILIVAGGSFAAAEGILQPIRKMEKTASSITHGDDLNLRIDPGSSEDELYHLANTFNDMFERLEQDFLREKQFISDASHELRTPVAVIQTEAEYALAKERTPEEYSEGMRAIQRQARRMKNLVEDLLGLRRLSAPGDYYDISEVDLSSLVAEVCEDMGRISRKRVTITVYAEPGITVLGSRDLLERMLVNLLDNADKYGREGGYTEVTLARLTPAEQSGVELQGSRLQARRSQAELQTDRLLERGSAAEQQTDWLQMRGSAAEQQANRLFSREKRSATDPMSPQAQAAACLTVRDDGQGISPEAKDRIFDRFFREDTARSSAGGYGLGLALVREIVRLHGGSISVDSTPGEGSVFTVTISGAAFYSF